LAAGTHHAQLTATTATGQALQRTWSFSVSGPPAAATPSGPAGCTVAPPDGTRLSSGRPEVGATFAQPMQVPSIRLTLDGRDVTGNSRVTNEQVRFQPGSDLAAGTHHAQLTATTATGQALQRTWSFSVSGPPAAATPSGPAGCTVAPPDGTRLSSGRPEVGATFAQPMQVDSIRLVLDDRDVTAAASVNNGQVRYTPDELSKGTHVARVVGQTADGRPVKVVWSFVVTPPQVATQPSAPSAPSSSTTSRPSAGLTLAVKYRADASGLLEVEARGGTAPYGFDVEYQTGGRKSRTIRKHYDQNSPHLGLVTGDLVPSTIRIRVVDGARRVATYPHSSQPASSGSSGEFRVIELELRRGKLRRGVAEAPGFTSDGTLVLHQYDGSTYVMDGVEIEAVSASLTNNQMEHHPECGVSVNLVYSDGTTEGVTIPVQSKQWFRFDRFNPGKPVREITLTQGATNIVVYVKKVWLRVRER
ncbi:MAG: hypothetical protein AB1758_21625, partial [Candidatus Eremiobacterota bacterium]